MSNKWENKTARGPIGQKIAEPQLQPTYNGYQIHTSYGIYSAFDDLSSRLPVCVAMAPSLDELHKLLDTLPPGPSADE